MHMDTLDKFKKNIIVCIISLLSALSKYIPGSTETDHLTKSNDFNNKISEFEKKNNEVITILIENS
jgi:hypothetical protein